MCACISGSLMPPQGDVNGDGVGMVVRCMWMGWGWKKFAGDGAGMGLIFTTVSLFSCDVLIR